MSDAPTGHRFVVRGNPTPDFPLRVLDLFAQRVLRFDRVAILDRADHYELIIQQHGLTPEQAEILLHKIGAMVSVASAELHPIDQGAAGTPNCVSAKAVASAACL